MIVRDRDKISRSDNILMQQVSEQAVLLNPADGQYFALDDIGSRIWELCDGSLTLAQIATKIHEEYDAPLDVIIGDVTELITEFCNEKLVTATR